jgi:hypothetical protein
LGRYLIGGGAGFVGYTGSKIAGNAIAGKWGNLTDGVDLNQASLAGIASGATSAACTLAPGLGCALAGAGTSAAQYGLSTGHNPLGDPVGYLTAAGLGGVFGWGGGSAFTSLPLKEAPEIAPTAWLRLGLQQPDLYSALAGIGKGGMIMPFSGLASNLIHGAGCDFGIGQC